MTAMLERTRPAVGDDVRREIARDRRLAGYRVGVEETDRGIRLTGVVDCLARKRDAEEAAYRVGGVTEVANEIEIRWDYVHGLRDFDLLAEAPHLLDSHYLLRSRKLGVTVDSGQARLTGRVETLFERDEAERMLATLASLRAIRNDLVVGGPIVPPKELCADVESALERMLGGDARRIEVEVTGRTVWLVGSIRSRAERAACLAEVARTNGVAEIRARLDVSGPNP